jgi:glycosyltransferase involved in cell wall biosynthesis
MAMNNTKISIILPNYNGEKYLELAINSFVEQSYPYKELVIVDGKSTDGSHDIIKRYVEQNSNILWIKELDSGISNANNIGISKCSGDIIGYLGNDDILYKDIFSEIAYHARLINFDTIYFDSYRHHIQENRCQLLKSRPDALERGSLLIYGNYVPGQNIFFKRHIFDKYKYNTDNKYSMDYELYLDFSEENYLHLYVPEVAVTSIFDGNISNSLRMQQASKSAHIALKHSRSTREVLSVYGRYFSVRGTRKLIHILTSSLKLIFNYKKYRKSTDGILFASCMKKIIAKRSRRHIYGAKNS